MPTEARLEVKRRNGRLKGELTELTPRQLEVLKLTADGYEYKRVGYELGITEPTVRSMAVEIREKLGALSMAHAVAIAFRMGLLS